MPQDFPFIHSPANAIQSLLATLGAQGNAAKLGAYDPLMRALAGVGHDVGQGFARRTGYEQQAAAQKAEQDFRVLMQQRGQDFSAEQNRLAQEASLKEKGIGEGRRWAEDIGGAISNVVGGIKDAAYKAGQLRLRAQDYQTRRDQLALDKQKEENRVRSDDRKMDLIAEDKRSLIQMRADASADRAQRFRVAAAKPRLEALAADIKTATDEQAKIEKRLMLGISDNESADRTKLGALDRKLDELRKARDKILTALEGGALPTTAAAETAGPEAGIDEDIAELGER